MTAAPADSDSTPLPLWRLIAGFGVIAIMLALLAAAGSVYLKNLRLDRYMRELAADPASLSLSDSFLTGRILERAKEFDLPLKTTDIAVVRVNGRPHIQISKYMVETSVVRMDLRMPAASSR